MREIRRKYRGWNRGWRVKDNLLLRMYYRKYLSARIKINHQNQHHFQTDRNNDKRKENHNNKDRGNNNSNRIRIGLI